MSGWALAPIIVVSLLFGAFFSGAEIALLTADRALLKRRMKAGSRTARLVEHFIERPQWFLATTLVGGTLSLVCAAVPATWFANQHFKAHGLLLAFLVLTPLFLFFGRILPKVYFQPRANQAAALLIIALRFFFYLFYPVLILVIGLTGLVQKILGRGRGQGAFWYTREELQLLLTDPRSRTILDQEGRLMVDRIFEFGETRVEDVMIPLVQMEALEETATVGEALRKISQRMHSRYPVYRDRIDNVVGVLESFDLLEVDDLFAAILPWAREVRYVPYSKSVDDLLFAMQRENFSFAVVVDEHGGCIGVITREDILEEIVGEIHDEYDKPVVPYRRMEDGRVSIVARMEIDRINEVLGWNLPEGDYETLAGFLLAHFQRVPKVSERFRYRDLAFTVTSASPRAILEVMVEKGGGQEGKNN